MSDKSEFLKAVAQECGLTQATVDLVLRGVSNEVRRRLFLGNSVRVAGIGKFHVVYRKPRVARSNMLKGADGKGVLINIPAGTGLKFKPLPGLIQAARSE